MKWIKQMFGIKEDDIQLSEKFKNASATSELVITPRNIDTIETYSVKDLNKLTKVEIDDLAKNKLGIDLDRRAKKELMIQEYIEAQNSKSVSYTHLTLPTKA